MVCTRPDLSQTVRMKSRYMHDPGKRHWRPWDEFCGISKVPVSVGLVFEKDDHSKKEQTGYVDSDYARDLDKRRSSTWHVFTLSHAPVSWRYTLQVTVTLSTTEAEYMTLTEVVKKAIWLQGLMDDLRIEQEFLKVNCDSMSAIYLTKNQVWHVRRKHIDARYHFVRDILEDGDIELKKIHTKNNQADMLTKVIPEVKFNHCKNLLHILLVAWARWSSFGWTTWCLIP